MRDDHAGGARIDLLRRLPRETLPILRLEVLAVNAVDHPSPDVADLEEFRHAEHEVRHEGALVRFAFRMNDDRVSLTGIRAVQDGPDPGRVVHRPRNRSARYGLCAASLMTVAHDGGRCAAPPERF